MVGCDLASVLAAEGGNLIPTSHKTKFVSIFYFCSVLKATSVFAYRMLKMSVSSSTINTVKHCVSVLYRPPSSPVSFFDNLY